MQVPIMKQGPYLIATIQGEIVDEDFIHLRTKLVRMVSKNRSRGVVIDVSSLDTLDSFATRSLRDMAKMIELQGAETVIVGIQPDVALAMVRLGLFLKDIITMMDLEDGFSYLKKSQGKRISHD
ncbi:MAG: STAS domain-containing protein [Euryarchaeota archaeon]|nr:STAS domain-containing protein [Euryarchaeota archaeon]